jgi:hypothetical protein
MFAETISVSRVVERVKDSKRTETTTAKVPSCGTQSRVKCFYAFDFVYPSPSALCLLGFMLK